MPSPWHSQEDLLRDSNSHSDTGNSTMPESRAESRSGSPDRKQRPRKRVNWHLPEETDTTFDTQQGGQGKPSRTRVNTNLDSQASVITASNHNQARLEESDADPNSNVQQLREDLHILLGPQNQSSRPSFISRWSDNITPRFIISPPSESVNASSTTPPSHTRHPSKSVLRKGDVTPQMCESEDHGIYERDIQDLEGKKNSAVGAQLRALKVAESLHSNPQQSSAPHSRNAGTLFSTFAPKKNGHSSKKTPKRHEFFHEGDALKSGQASPDEDYEDYIPEPSHWRTSGLSAINLLQKATRHGMGSRRSSLELDTSRPNSPSRSASPGYFSKKNKQGSSSSLANLVQSSSAQFGSYAGSDIGVGLKDFASNTGKANLKSPRSSTLNLLDTFRKGFGSSGIDNSIKKHIEETRQAHRYLVKLCKALMIYGAPTHRLEEYMTMSSRVLRIEAQFLYIPGCMIASFDDSQTYTTEVKLIRVRAGVDLSKLRDTHDVYKDIVHDNIGVTEGCERLDEISQRTPKFPRYIQVLMHGLASASVGPFAFGARPIDIAPCFLLGCGFGVIRVYLAPLSDLYSAVTDVFGVIVTSFVSRALGSINGGDLFCFAALTQSSIALILPGYTLLTAALELQSLSIVAGAARLVYGIMLSLFIGYSITVGITVYGMIDHNATTATTCHNPVEGNWFMAFVPIFAGTLAVLNQAKWKDMPWMVVLAFSGWLVDFYTSKPFASNLQISNTIAAFAIGVLANGSSRLEPQITRIETKVLRFLMRTFSKGCTSLGLAALHEETSPSSLEKQLDCPDNEHKQNWFVRGLNKLRAKDTANRKAENMSNVKKSGNSTNTDSPEPSLSDTVQTVEKRKRVSNSLAATAMMPALFVLVPSGLSVSGSLVSSIKSAEQISHNTTGSSTISASDVLANQTTGTSDETFGVAYSVIQIAIGMTIGLLFAGIFVYPTGKGGRWGSGRKMRSGLFSF